MSSDRMGLNRGDVLNECDGCESTVLCKPSDLKSWGWKRHGGGSGDKKWGLLLCDSCQARSDAVKASA